MIRNLIFDMGGVILPMQDIEEPIHRFGQIGLPRDEAVRLFGLHGQQEIFRDVESGALTADAFLAAYRELTGYPATFADIEWAWRGFVSDPPPERLLWLRQLMDDGYHVALLSNTNPFLMHFCDSAAFTPEGQPISHYFHRIFYSYRLGACKPDTLAFSRMLEQGSYVPEECIFLDDGVSNVEAARQMGLHAIHVPDNQDWIVPLRRELKLLSTSE
ncbi:MAG: HAD family phosphatase [Prevotellaceae bacterium]|nr:HAD family phosphatase [Prevotellaceae bacterium]